MNPNNRPTVSIEPKAACLSDHTKRTIADQGSDACRRHILGHSAGIVNSAIRAVALDPYTGRHRDSDTPGTGSPMKWGQHYFILSAAHLFESAEPSDLRILTFENLPADYIDPKAAKERDVADGSPLTSDSKIHRCEQEDLAIATVDPKRFPGVDFTDLAENSIDPAAGEHVSGCGFPSDNYVAFKKQRGNEQVELAIYPTLFGGAVLPFPSEDEVKFYYSGDLNEEKHYLIPYELPGVSEEPAGVSGTAVWLWSQEDSTHLETEFQIRRNCHALPPGKKATKSC